MPNDEMLKKLTPAQALAGRLKSLAKAIDNEALNDDTGPIAESLVEVLEAIVAGDPLGIALVALGDDLLVDDLMLVPGLPPGGVFEMVGRIQALGVRLSMLATHIETSGNDEEDHTGHGCEQDPQVRAKSAN